MMADNSYERARANVDRLMEQVGKSINAYEDVGVGVVGTPIPAGAVEVRAPNDDEPVEDIDPATYLAVMTNIAGMDREAEAEAPEVPNSEHEKPSPALAATESFDEGHDPLEPRITCPHCHEEIEYSDLLGESEGFAISTEYYGQGMVEGAGELEKLWRAFVAADLADEPTEVELDTGTYELQGTKERGFTLLDTAKGYFYVVEKGRNGELCNVLPEDLFIWILRDSDRDGDALGYLLNGWIFVRKGILPS
jgi:hypothetical protein